MNRPFQRANWIWHGTPDVDLVNTFMQARRVFDLKTVPRRAVIAVTADQAYRLYVNGSYICRGPARGFQHAWPYDRADIAPFLRRGRNVIAALVHNPGVGTFQYIHMAWAGFMLAGQVGGVNLTTNAQWRVRRAPAYRRVLTRLSAQLGFQEWFDARLDDGAWVRPMYDDRAWIVPVLHAVGKPPWTGLEERGTAMPEERLAVPVALAARATGRVAPGWAESDNVVTLHLAERRDWKPLECPVSEEGRALTFTVHPPPAGAFVSYVVDAGAETVASPIWEATGASAGTVLDYIGCEALEGLRPSVAPPESSPNFVAMGGRLILRSGVTRHEQFAVWGFRYLVLTVRNACRPFRLRVTFRRQAYPAPSGAMFNSSNERLNAIYRVCRHTLRCCMLDALVADPWREQAQWLSDARLIARTAFFVSPDARLFARCLRQIGMQTAESGLTYALAPTVGYNHVLPDYTLLWILGHWDYYWQTGDCALFRASLPEIERALVYFHDARRAYGLLPHDDRYWLFVDWAPALFKDGYSTTYNLMYRAALLAAGRLYRLIGYQTPAVRCDERAARLGRTIRAHLFDRRSGCFYSGLTRTLAPVRQADYHACAWAILSNLMPDRHAEFAARLVGLLAGQRDVSPMPSAAFMAYIFEGLTGLGRRGEVVNCIERWWGDMVLDRGSTTTPESWPEIIDEISFGAPALCHGWAAHPLAQLVAILGGIGQTGPAWRTIRYEPLLTQERFVNTVVVTPRGPIRSRWRRTRAGVEVKLTIPRGVRAQVVLPGIRRTIRGPRCCSWLVMV